MIQDPDRYVVPARRAQAQLVEKRSRFVAVAAPAFTPEEAQELIAAERQRWHDAAHHPYAWNIGTLERYSDDGEPAGTAGKPIAGAIAKSGLESVVVVVNRYFGGIKLGPSGLVRAFGEAAREALVQSGEEERFHTARLTVTFDFDLTSPVHHTLQQFTAHTVAKDFSDRARLVVEVRRSRLDRFREALCESTAGRAEIVHE